MEKPKISVTQLISKLDNEKVNTGDIVRIGEEATDAADILSQPGHRYHIKYQSLSDDRKASLYQVL